VARTEPATAEEQACRALADPTGPEILRSAVSAGSGEEAARHLFPGAQHPAEREAGSAPRVMMSQSPRTSLLALARTTTRVSFTWLGVAAGW
jgi:hypothetical protein